MNQEELPIVHVEHRKVVKVGGSRMICLPAEWCEEHQVTVGQDVAIVFGDDLRILAPESVPRLADIQEEVLAQEK